jgi:hypothetical protein
MSQTSYVISIALSLFFLMGGIAVMLRPSIYFDSRHVRETYDPKWIERSRQSWQTRALALAPAFVGVGIFSGVLGDLSGSKFLKAFESNLLAPAMVTLFIACFGRLASLVITKIRQWTGHPSPEPPALSEAQDKQRNRKLATVFLILFLGILSVEVICTALGWKLDQTAGWGMFRL